MRGKRSFLCGRDTRTHILRYGLDDEAARSRGWSLRPIRDDRKRNTAEFLVPRANAPYRRRRAVVRRGLRDRRHWPKKTHSFSQQRSRKQKAVAARRGAVHRGPLVKILFTSVTMAVRSRAALRHGHSSSWFFRAPV